MPIRIPARNVAGDQILRSATRTDEVQHVEYPVAQMVNSHVKRVAGVAGDTLLSMITRVGVNAPGAAAAAIPISANRGLRIVSLALQYSVITATTPPTIVVRLRHNSAANTIALTNHQVNQWLIGPTAVVVNVQTHMEVTLPFGGLDIPPQANAQAIGFSYNAPVGTVGNGNISISMIAYEYA